MLTLNETNKIQKKKSYIFLFFFNSMPFSDWFNGAWALSDFRMAYIHSVEIERVWFSRIIAIYAWHYFWALCRWCHWKDKINEEIDDSSLLVVKRSSNRRKILRYHRPRRLKGEGEGTNQPHIRYVHTVHYKYRKLLKFKWRQTSQLYGIFYQYVIAKVSFWNLVHIVSEDRLVINSSFTV